MLGGTVLSWRLARNVVNSEVDKKFQEDAAQIETWIQERLNAYTLVLSGARAFVERSELITAGEWENYIKSLDLYKKYPVSSALYMEARGDEYIIKYAEPLVGNEKLLGVDMKKETKRLSAFENARSSGEIATTGRIKLTTTNKDGFLMVMPIYGSSALHKPGAGDDLLGFVALVFDEDALFKIHFANSDPFPDLDFEIYEGKEAAGSLIYDHDTTQLASSLKLNSQRKILSSGDFWTLSISPKPTYSLSPAGMNLPRIVLFSGLALAFLFTGLGLYLPSRASHLSGVPTGS